MVAGEVWQYAGPQVKGTKRLVLARLAAYANDRRITWVGIDTLMRETAASRSAVYEAVTWLRKHGFIQEVDPDILDAERIPYEATVHRITERELWNSGRPADVWRGDIPSPDSGLKDPIPSPDSGNRVGIRSPDSGLTESGETDIGGYNSSGDLGPSPETGPYINTSKYKKKKTSSFSSLATGSRGTRSRQGKTGVDKPDEYDPSVYLFADEEPPAEPEARSGRRGPGPDTGMGLAIYFCDAVRRTGAWRGLDIANQTQLASAFNRWKRNGLSPDYIREMIDLYVDDEGLRNNRAVPWTDFLAKRAVLDAKLSRYHEYQQWAKDFEAELADEEGEVPEGPRQPDPIWG